MVNPFDKEIKRMIGIIRSQSAKGDWVSVNSSKYILQVYREREKLFNLVCKYNIHDYKQSRVGRDWESYSRLDELGQVAVRIKEALAYNMLKKTKNER